MGRNVCRNPNDLCWDWKKELAASLFEKASNPKRTNGCCKYIDRLFFLVCVFWNEMYNSLNYLSSFSLVAHYFSEAV